MNMKMAKPPPADGKEDTHVKTVPMLETPSKGYNERTTSKGYNERTTSKGYK